MIKSEGKFITYVPTYINTSKWTNVVISECMCELRVSVCLLPTNGSFTSVNAIP